MNQPETEKIEPGQFTLHVLREAIQSRSVEQIKAVTMTLSVHPWHFHGCTLEARGHWMTNNLANARQAVKRAQDALSIAQQSEARATDELAGELHEWTGTELLAAFLAEQAKGGVS